MLTTTALTTRARRAQRFTPPMRVTPDGRWLATWSGYGLRIFDAAEVGPPVLHRVAPISALVCAGPWLALATGASVELLRVEDLSSAAVHALPAPIERLAIDAAGARLVALDKNGALHKLTLAADGAASVESIAGEPFDVGALAISRDGRWAAYSACKRDARSCPVSLIDLDAFKLVQLLKGPRSHVNEIAFSPDAATLIAATFTTLTAWSLPKGKARAIFKPKSYANIVGFVDDTHVIVLDHREEVVCLDLTTDQPVWAHPNYGPAELSAGRLVHNRFNSLYWRDPLSGALERSVAAPDSIWTLALDPTRDQVHLGFYAGCIIRTWQLNASLLDPSPEGAGGPITSVASTPDGKWLALGTHEGVVMLWDLDQPERVHRIFARPHYFSRSKDCESVFIDPEHDAVWAGVGDRIARWELSTGELVALSDALKDDVTALLPLHERGVIVAAAQARRRSYGALVALDLSTFSPVHDERLSRTVNAIERAPDGEILVRWQDSASALDPVTWAMRALTPAFPFGFASLIVSPDASRACSRITTRRPDGQDDHALQRWTVEAEPKPIGEPHPTPYMTATARYSADGADLFTLHAAELRRWDADTLELRAAYPLSQDRPEALYLTADGRRAVVCATDGAADLITLEPHP